MENNTITAEQYIEHEVKLRVMKEVNDERFLKIDERFVKIEEKLVKLDQKIENGFLLLVGLIITSIVMPVVLHSLKLL